jgi:hypothetical protein
MIVAGSANIGHEAASLTGAEPGFGRQSDDNRDPDSITLPWCVRDHQELSGIDHR